MPGDGGEWKKQEWGGPEPSPVPSCCSLPPAIDLTWGTTKMSEKMMAASRGNRLSGCQGKEAASVRGLGLPPHGGPGQAHGAVGSSRVPQFTGATPTGQTQGFSPTPSGRGEAGHRPAGGCSPAVSAHSRVWGSGKWQRNPAPPGSPGTLQGTGMHIMGCAPGPPCHVPPAHPLPAHRAGSALPAAYTTPGCAPSPPRGPLAETCHSSAWGSPWGCG